MKTEVIMKRELFGSEISQQSLSSFLSATDLIRVGNLYRLSNKLPTFDLNIWLQSKGTKEFISELEKQFGQVKINSKGKNQHTWVHPFLFIDIALAINPSFKVEVYSWLYDSLLKYRNNSGDSYKKMCGALYENCNNKSNFHRGVTITAKLIQNACNVKDWQSANEQQLNLRDKIHENIALLCDVLRDNNQAIRIGITKALKQ
jgi:KilA-N domain